MSPSVAEPSGFSEEGKKPMQAFEQRGFDKGNLGKSRLWMDRGNAMTEHALLEA